MKSGNPENRKRARKKLQINVKRSERDEWDFLIGEALDIGTGNSSNRIRPEKVALGKKLAADPDYPSKPSMRRLARVLIDKL